MIDVQGCHLRIASVRMIDPSLQRGQFKFTLLALNLHCAFPQVRYSAADDDDVYSSLTEGRGCIQLAQWAELMP